MPTASHLPQGASSLLIAMNTPWVNGLTGLPVLLWGRPGVGKSSFIEGLATDKTKIITLIASIHDPTDFSGLPIHHEGEVRYAPPAWVREFKAAEDGILFLDELSTCPPAVQAALLRVVLERRVGFELLPDSVRIVAAANPPDLMVGGWELSPPMRNRFIHLNWDISPELFNAALLDGWQVAKPYTIPPEAHKEALPVWKARVAAFLRVSPHLLHGDPAKEQYGFASPRTWEFAAHLMASCEVLGMKPDLNLLRGCLGEGTAIALAEYLEQLKQPDPEDVLSGRVVLKPNTMNDGEVYILFAGCERVLLRDINAGHFLKYASNFLDITQQISGAGRQDVIFVSLRKLAKAGFLTRVLVAAQLQGDKEKSAIMAKITNLFNHHGLKEFIDVLT